MNLDATNKSLEVVLGSAVTTNQLPFVVSYGDITIATGVLSALGENDGTTNSGTAVTLVSAPSSGVTRKVSEVSVYNHDTADADVTVQVNNNGTKRTVITATLATKETLAYTEGSGWRVLTATGALKNSV